MRNPTPNTSSSFKAHRHNMKSALFSAFIMAITCLFSCRAEECEDSGIPVETQDTLEGQPMFVECPLSGLDENMNNFTWQKIGSNISISIDQHSRIHINGNWIRFIPARSEDSGVYECVSWYKDTQNSFSCSNASFELIVYKNNNGLCYNSDAVYNRTINSESAKIECLIPQPILASKHAPITWYKECEQMSLEENARFKAFDDVLNGNNMTAADDGIYTCEVIYEYDGQLYNVSQTTKVKVRLSKPKMPLVVIDPKNNSVEANIGQSVCLNCTLLYNDANNHEIGKLHWVVNDTYPVDNFNDSRIQIGRTFERKLTDGTKTWTLNLTILEVKSGDYEKKFVCTIQSDMVHSAFFVYLQDPASNLQMYLVTSIVVFALSILIAVFIYKSFKMDIVLWFRDFYNSPTSDKDGKVYDAYVMFPNHTSANYINTKDFFVINTLPEVLENKCGYKLFITGRDDLPGEAVADLIHETIKQSRRLLIILTGKNSSEYFFNNAFEQQLTLYNALISNSLKVIMIELEKIDDYTNMPESIKYIKQKQGSIRWKGDLTEKSLSPSTRFWKKVRYQMPNKRNRENVMICST